jgi:uncharacterized RDD family membrane protein YckC
MSTSEKDKCEHCGAVIPATSTERLCPACLLSGALEPPGGEAATISMGRAASLSAYGPSEFPCEFGGYRLLGMLGRGGMGTVYEAEHLATGRRVALKMLGQQLDSPEMRQRFLREGRLAAGVNHPNSLYIFGSEEIEGLPVITMEIAGSGTLKDQLKKRGPLPVADAVDAILDVISGLESAFAGGVLHRDIKPSNCFVCPDGSVKVGDFGLSVSTLARHDTFVTAHGRIMGTPAYASPEQLRGDALDVRADIYSVGATLYTLLTDRAPFEGDNAVQVVANAVNQKPRPLTETRDDVPPALARVVARCLAKEPDGRYVDYAALRHALLPFSSRVPEPASMKLRGSAGWIDYLTAFLVPYVALMFSVGEIEFHVRPFLDGSFYAYRYHLICYGLGFLYFAIVEGIWGAGLGKWLKGLRVVRSDGRPPGFVRALVRIVIPILCIEGVRIPLLLATISARTVDEWGGMDTLYQIGISNVTPWLAVLLAWCARRDNGFATVWDRLTGTRVIVRPKSIARPSLGPIPEGAAAADSTERLGPYRVVEEMVPGQWIVATDPVLRRRVWLLRREGSELPAPRRSLARPGRLRWLQKVETADAIWDAFEARGGEPFSTLVKDGRQVPWSRLRHWLHDLAAEMWAAIEDRTLATELSLDHVWITTQGQAVLLDEPWPASIPAERVGVADLAGQQRFLSAVAARVEPTNLPLHARGVLQNLAVGKFEKLSFLTGVLRGLQDKPADVSKGIRAGSLFMLPVYICIMVLVGYCQEETVQAWQGHVASLVLFCIMVILGGIALAQLLEFPFRTTASHSIFRLVVVNDRGARAGMPILYRRWAIVWLPLLLPLFGAWLLLRQGQLATFCLVTLSALVPWIGLAVYAVFHPHRGLHDRLAGTWVVRR